MYIIYILNDITILLIYILGIYFSIKGFSKNKILNKGVLIFFSILLFKKIYRYLSSEFLRMFYSDHTEKTIWYFRIFKEIPDMFLYLLALLVFVCTLYKIMREKNK